MSLEVPMNRLPSPMDELRSPMDDKSHLQVNAETRPDQADPSGATQPDLFEDAYLALIESERRFRNVFDASPIGIGLSDERGVLVTANRALCIFFGRTEYDLIGHSATEFTHPDDLHSPTDAHRMLATATDDVVCLERRYLRPDGEIRWGWLTVTMTTGPSDRPWTLSHIQDVTDRKLGELALRESESNLTAVAAVVRRIQCGEDARTTIVTAAKALSGGSIASLFEPDLRGSLVVTATTDPRLSDLRISLDERSVTAQVFCTGEALQLTDRPDDPMKSHGLLRTSDTKSMCVYPVPGRSEISGVLEVTWSEPSVTLTEAASRALVLLADEAGLALRQEQMVKELELLAITDDLTGLANRRGWDLQLHHLMATARLSGSPLTVAIADLDHFKVYNDTRGHVAGDDLLHEFASAARHALRAVDFLARWGGEEFAVALPNCGLDEAAGVLERIRKAVPDCQTCSFGYATWTGVESAPELMVRADAALYAAKAAGRDRIRGADLVSSDR
jgi:diguanylate cyclase (GGDEF)-like protein/PAS domain S-box-containing protein